MQKYTKSARQDIKYENGLTLLGILQRLQMDGIDLQSVTVEADTESEAYSDYEHTVCFLQYTVPMTEDEIEIKRRADRLREANQRANELALFETLKKKYDRKN